jgi:hypothetical protein
VGGQENHGVVGPTAAGQMCDDVGPTIRDGLQLDIDPGITQVPGDEVGQGLLVILTRIGRQQRVYARHGDQLPEQGRRIGLAACR